MKSNSISLEQLQSEGDLNLSSHRQAWLQEHLDEPTRFWLAEDAKYFLHQSLSMIAREELNIAPQKALGHYTHEKNPVAAAAALATIEVIETEGILEKVRHLGAYALQRLRALADRYELIGEVRGLGLLLGVELVRNRETKERALNEAEQVMYRALAKGLNFKLTMGNILTLTPALTISPNEIDQALDILDASLAEVRKS